jgi:uncharacterized membrane protein YqjE
MARRHTVAGDRSFTDLFQDILRNLQEMIRSEVKLAQTEIREEAAKVLSSGLWLMAGGVVALLALLFVMWAIVYALALVWPIWSAVLLVAMVLLIAASILLVVGVRRVRRVRPIPERTMESMREHVEWVKQFSKL